MHKCLILLLFCLCGCYSYNLSYEAFQKYRDVEIEADNYVVSDEFLLFFRPAIAFNQKGRVSSGLTYDLENKLQSLLTKELQESKVAFVKNPPVKGSMLGLPYFEDRLRLSRMIDFIVLVDINTLTIQEINIPQTDGEMIQGICSQSNCAIYEVEVNLKLGIFDLPDTKEVFNYKIQDVFRVTIEGKVIDTKERSNEVINQVINRLKTRVFPQMNMFFNKNGVVLERKSYRDSNILKINLGYLNSLQEGDKVNIYNYYDRRNLVASGHVSNRVYGNYAWIILDKKSRVNWIKRGDEIFVVK